MSDFLAALCLMAVLEGLLLLALPQHWKQVMTRLSELDDVQLRRIGGMAVVGGMTLLYLVRR